MPLQVINCTNCGQQLAQINKDKQVKSPEGQAMFTLRGKDKKTIVCPNCGTKNGIY